MRRRGGAQCPTGVRTFGSRLVVDALPVAEGKVKRWLVDLVDLVGGGQGSMEVMRWVDETSGGTSVDIG